MLPITGLASLATGRLSEYGPSGKPLQPSPILSPLKATGRPGFSHTIFPKSHEAFDLLCVGTYRRPAVLNQPAELPPASGPFNSQISAARIFAPVGGATTSIIQAASGTFEGPPIAPLDQGVYLNSALDVVGAGRLPITSGAWVLRYEFYAIDFPLLSVAIKLTVTDWNEPVATIVSQEVR